MRVKIDQDILDALTLNNSDASPTWKINSILADSLGLPERVEAIERKRMGGLMRWEQKERERLAKLPPPPTPASLVPVWEGHQPKRRKYDE